MKYTEIIKSSADEYEQNVQQAAEELYNLMLDTPSVVSSADSFNANEKDIFIDMAHNVAEDYGIEPETVLGELYLQHPEISQKMDELSESRWKKENEEWLKRTK